MSQGTSEDSGNKGEGKEEGGKSARSSGETRYITQKPCARTMSLGPGEIYQAAQPMRTGHSFRAGWNLTAPVIHTTKRYLPLLYSFAPMFSVM